MTSIRQNVARQTDDIDEYIGLCTGGAMYERLMELVGMAPTSENRDQVKKLFFAIAYGEVKHGDTRVGRAFQAAFPRCWEAVCRLKRGEHGHGGLARWMQTIESWTAIWRVGNRILREYPHAPLLTIHDSLVTTKEFVGPFRALMADEFERVWRVVPRFKESAFGA